MRNRVANSDDKVKDSVISVRLDRRSLATLAMFFEKTGDYPTNASTLVRMIVEELKEILIDHSLIEDVISTDDATNILRRFGITKLNPGRRGSKTYQKQLELQSLEAEFGKDSLEAIELLETNKITKGKDAAMLKEALRLQNSAAWRRQLRESTEKTDDSSSEEATDRIIKHQNKDQGEKDALLQGPTIADG